MGFPGSQSRTLNSGRKLGGGFFILLWLVIGVVRPAQAQGIVYEYSAITEVQKGLKLKVPVDSTLLIVMLLKLGLRQASGLSW